MEGRKEGRAEKRKGLLLLAGLALLGAPLQAQDSIGPRPEYAELAQRLETFIRHEMADKGIPAVSIALVDRSGIIWSRGFGLARPEDSVPATAETIYRVGAISELFTTLAVLAEVRAGRVSLDGPVTTYLPDFHPGKLDRHRVTLRALLNYEAGLVREPPVGNSYDSTAPGLRAAIHSLNTTELWNPPNTSQRYSAAGIAVAGEVLAHVRGKSFAEVVREEVLAPLGMNSSSFRRADVPGGRLASGTIRSPDARSVEAPVFDLGVSPAGNLYSTANDLGRAVSSFLRESTGPASGSLWAGYAALIDANSYASLSLSYSGGLYGFTARLRTGLDGKLGIVVLCALDGANAFVDRIAGVIGGAMTRPALPDTSSPVDSASVHRLAGFYRGNGRPEIELRARNGQLLLVRPLRMPVVLRKRGDDLVVDDIRTGGPPLLELGAGLIDYGGRAVKRQDPPVPAEPGTSWRALIGEYGPEFDPIFILEDHGRLAVLLDWWNESPLDSIGPDRFGFGFQVPSSPYAGERIAIVRDSVGRPDGLTMGGVYFPRRAVGPEDGVQLSVTPNRPVPDLIREALAATPPAQPDSLRPPDLVDLATLDPTIQLDIRYATTNNFLGSVFYSSARAFLQRPAAMALLRVHQALKARGYGLLIHDAYRPWYVTRVFWDATPERLRWLVANPVSGSRHNRGSRRGPHALRPRHRPAGRDARDLRRVHLPVLRRLPRRHLAGTLVSAGAPGGDGSRGVRRQPGGVVALRLQGVAELPDPEPAVRGPRKRTVTGPIPQSPNPPIPQSHNPQPPFTRGPGMCTFLVPQVRRALAREPRQDLAGSSAKRCPVSLRVAWGTFLSSSFRPSVLPCDGTGAAAPAMPHQPPRGAIPVPSPRVLRGFSDCGIRSARFPLPASRFPLPASRFPLPLPASRFPLPAYLSPMTIALARRYRPRRFSELIVQDHVANVLRGAIAKHRVGHGYLLTGPRGVGKTTAARILAMALNCERKDQVEPAGEPCGECASCTRIWSGGANLDVVEIDAASNRGVDDARDLRERAMYAASEPGHYKVYIVDEAHMLTREAWNALLKILEEPPPGGGVRLRHDRTAEDRPGGRAGDVPAPALRLPPDRPGGHPRPAARGARRREDQPTRMTP